VTSVDTPLFKRYAE